MTRQQQNDEGWTEKSEASLPNQQQEPKPSREAGRELDALIAEKVMGRRVARSSQGPLEFFGNHEDGSGFFAAPRRYSTEIALAWRVVERVCSREFSERDLGVRLSGNPADGWSADVYDTSAGGYYLASSDEVVSAMNEVSAYARTAPHAICLAALDAIASVGIA